MTPTTKEPIDLPDPEGIRQAPLTPMERNVRVVVVCTAVNALCALVQLALWWARWAALK